MTRSASTLLVCGMTLLVGLATSILQAENHERARRLAEGQRRVEMLEAEVAELRILTEAHVPGIAGPHHVEEFEELESDAALAAGEVEL